VYLRVGEVDVTGIDVVLLVLKAVVSLRRPPRRIGKKDGSKKVQVNEGLRIDRGDRCTESMTSGQWCRGLVWRWG
jgi:hypothetical protein